MASLVALAGMSNARETDVEGLVTAYSSFTTRWLARPDCHTEGDCLDVFRTPYGSVGMPDNCLLLFLLEMRHPWANLRRP